MMYIVTTSIWPRTDTVLCVVEIPEGNNTESALHSIEQYRIEWRESSAALRKSRPAHPSINEAKRHTNALRKAAKKFQEEHIGAMGILNPRKIGLPGDTSAVPVPFFQATS